MTKPKPKNTLCPDCEGCYGWKGYCPTCGAFDCCYYGFCKLENEVTKDIVNFANDMQGNPQMKKS